MARHPIQPLITDAQGVLRFKANAIVQHLLDNGGIDMNRLAGLPFSEEDRQQFAQLIGYSLSGYGELSYVTGEAYGAADSMHTLGMDERDARIDILETMVEAARNATKDLATSLFNIHSDDLQP